MKFEDSNWNLGDFVFKNTKIVGFSKEGKKKSENIHSLVLPGITDEGKKVKYIGYKAFIDCDIEEVDFSNALYLECINGFAFHSNNIITVDFTNNCNLFEISDNAFSDNSIENVIFTNCDKLLSISECAFYNNYISSLDLTPCINLSKIHYMAFSHNHISKIDIGNIKLEKVNKDAFAFNDLQQLPISDEVLV